MGEAEERVVREPGEFAAKVVNATRRQLGLKADVEDLMQYGIEGLLEARRAYDYNRGVRFKTFAYPRIRGAVIDGARTMDGLSRRALAKVRAVEAINDCTEELLTVKAKGRLNRDKALRFMEETLGFAASAYAATMALDERERDHDSPEEALLHAERKVQMMKAIDQLPERMRKLIIAHHIEGRRLVDVATEMGRPKSWVTTEHSRALGQLRKALAAA